ncbi:MAG TPA: cell division protein FtsH, partial [Conexibacter sp.]|nr:cell division protein FtsH [Conexibacter sp.]
RHAHELYRLLPAARREFSSEPDYSDEIAREIDDEIRRIVETAHQSAKDILTEHRGRLEYISEILIKRETIESDQFAALLDGRTEEDVFGAEAPPPPEVPSATTTPERGRDTPRPLPRPGLAGGAAELRGLESPEKPELA